jgi:transcription elongation GreA/GreB family factor
MNKQILQQALLALLEAQLIQALAAVDDAHHTATHTENIAENKYDTLALEAAYLAHGQSLRVVALKEDIAYCKKIPIVEQHSNTAIMIGSLIQLEDAQEQQSYFYLCHFAGGSHVYVNEKKVQILSPEAPLGKALLGSYIDDKIQLKHANSNIGYCVSDIF